MRKRRFARGMSSPSRYLGIAGTLLGFVLLGACGSSPASEPIDDEPTEPTGDSRDGGQTTDPPVNDDPSTGDFGGDAGGGPVASDDCQKVDIVFIIDDSNSMAPKQENLAKNFPKFVETIEGFRTKGGAKLDWRVAVTTTTADGDAKQVQDGQAFAGVYRKAKSCGVDQRWIEGSDPEINTKFACLAKVGTGGSNFEAPLYAMKEALDDRVADGTNAGFLREDALLAVVVMTDEDDGSDGTIDSYVEVLNKAAHGPGRWAFAGIAADGCPLPIIGPQHSKRVMDLVSKAGTAGKFSSICPQDGDLTPALKASLGTFDAVCKTFAPPVN